jgi:hypothetical protein
MHVRHRALSETSRSLCFSACKTFQRWFLEIVLAAVARVKNQHIGRSSMRDSQCSIQSVGALFPSRWPPVDRSGTSDETYQFADLFFGRDGALQGRLSVGLHEKSMKRLKKQHCVRVVSPQKVLSLRGPSVFMLRTGVYPAWNKANTWTRGQR